MSAPLKAPTIHGQGDKEASAEPWHTASKHANVSKVPWILCEPANSSRIFRVGTFGSSLKLARPACPVLASLHGGDPQDHTEQGR